MLVFVISGFVCLRGCCFFMCDVIGSLLFVWLLFFMVLICCVLIVCVFVLSLIGWVLLI